MHHQETEWREHLLPHFYDECNRNFIFQLTNCLFEYNFISDRDLQLLIAHQTKNVMRKRKGNENRITNAFIHAIELLSLSKNMPAYTSVETSVNLLIY